MWRFEDEAGSVWDVALGRESWGVLCALFVRQVGDEVRQVQLDEASERDAQATLDELSPLAWQDLLSRSMPKQ